MDFKEKRLSLKARKDPGSYPPLLGFQGIVFIVRSPGPGSQYRKQQPRVGLGGTMRKEIVVNYLRRTFERVRPAPDAAASIATSVQDVYIKSTISRRRTS